MALCYKLFFVLSTAILIGDHVSRCENYWSPDLTGIFKIQGIIVDEMIEVKNTRFQDSSSLEYWSNILDTLSVRIKQFDWQDFYTLEPNPMFSFLNFLPTYLHVVDKPKETELFKSQALTNNYKNRIGKMIPKLKNSIEQFLQSSGPDDRYEMPFDDICPTDRSSYTINQRISITDICGSLNECSSVPHPYGSSSIETDVTTACTEDNECDLEKALPMMVGVFWYAMNDMILHRLCSEKCVSILGWENCEYIKTVERLQYEVTLMKAFTFALPQSLYFNQVWNPFLRQAVENRAFSNLDVAMSMIEEKRQDFDFTSLMCNTIKFTKACPYVDIYRELVFIKKAQHQRMNPGSVKDLRMQSKVDHAKMAQLQRDTVDHIELLGTITKLDENLEASVSGISSYFTELAKYDEGIANADVLFIQGKLNQYETDLADLETKLKDDFTIGMALMEQVAIFNLAEETAFLVARIAENCNPLRVIFGGSEPGDIAEQAAEVANAASKVVKATTLFISLNNLATDSQQIDKAFFGENSNQNQITSLKALVDKIRKNKVDEIEADGDKFVKEYADYTPQTDRSKLAYNNGLWSAYKDAMCEILNGDVGIGGSVPQSVAGGLLVCEKLEGTLAQFFTLREEIFDFQFQLVDALAKVVRGNMAKRLAKNIEGKGDVLPATELLLGFMMIQNRIQTHSSIYCDKLEYKQLGRPVEACSTINGLFSKYNLESLIAYQDTSASSLVERDVYIPTKPRFQGDTGYLDLNSLAENGHVVFKIPVKSSWLQHYRWILEGENIPFVEDFKIYLPHKEYKTGEELQHTTTRVTVTSIGGNAVSTIAPNTSPVYVLPSGHSTYVTVYEEGYPSCKSQHLIPNPYGLCNNLPDICDKSSREAGESLLPTILSYWKLSFTIQRGKTKLDWKAPIPSTNLMIRATLKLKMWLTGTGENDVPSHVQRPKDQPSTRNLCCDTGNKYRKLLGEQTKCKKCPDHSTSMLRGLFCEIDQEQSENTGRE